jgi:hypothetical protein
VDESNPYYFVRGDFLMASNGMTFVRYFGHSDNLVLGRDFDAMGIACFAGCKHLLTVGFEAGSRLLRIEQKAFVDCLSLKSICIAASVEVISESSFYGCSSLSQITFESDSRLAEIGRDAFSNCSSLVSICIPAGVERILTQTFTKCRSLKSVSFERGSKMSQIDFSSFEECPSIRAFCVPAQLEVMDWGLLWCCVSLSQLTFEAPSHLRELGLPPSGFGSLRIPDSVAIISGYLRKKGARNCALLFGEESQLKAIELKPSRVRRRSANVTPEAIGMFLRFSEREMRHLRSKCESS